MYKQFNQIKCAQCAEAELRDSLRSSTEALNQRKLEKDWVTGRLHYQRKFVYLANVRDVGKFEALGQTGRIARWEVSICRW